MACIVLLKTIAGISHVVDVHASKQLTNREPDEDLDPHGLVVRPCRFLPHVV